MSNNEELAKGIEYLKNIKVDDRVLTRKCMCGTDIPILENTKRLYSGIVNFSEAICSSCRKDIDRHSRIVCLNCKTLMGYIEPGKHKVGFEFLAGKCYHIQTCPKCVTTNYATPILELDHFCADRGIPTKKDLDLVEECEKKAGQGDKKASLLRSSLIKGPTNK